VTKETEMITRGSSASRLGKVAVALFATVMAVGVMTAFTNGPGKDDRSPVDQAMVLRGRELVIQHACGG
jgi:hypothetical protein